jgi:serine/threonine protein kinase
MYLPTETILNNRYRVDAIIGQGGFGVTYLAQDLTLHVKVAVKEYLPRQMASRTEGQTKVTVYSGEAREHFDYGLKKFLEEARSVAKFANHHNIVSARDYFEANGTAYMVMEYIEGVTFKQFLEQKGGRIPFELASQIMMPVMDALREVHGTGLLHRDISPDNVYITADGRIKLLDFGAARYFSGEYSKSLSVILKTGYAPEEQYRSRGKQGAWTDVYATAATLYRAITGRTPPDALDRKEEDTLEPPSRLGIVITPEAEQALMKALAVNAHSRFQNMGDFQNALHSGAALPVSPAAPTSDGFTQPYHSPPQWAPDLPAGQILPQPGSLPRKRTSLAAAAIIISVAALVLVGSGVLWFASRPPAPARIEQSLVSQTIAKATPTPAPLPPAPAVASPVTPPPVFPVEDLRREAEKNQATLRFVNFPQKWMLNYWESNHSNKKYYEGYLTIVKSVSENQYVGQINASSGNLQFYQDANITVVMNKVEIICSNIIPRSLSPDKFFLKLKDNLMEGEVIDAKGRTGKAVFRKMEDGNILQHAGPAAAPVGPRWPWISSRLVTENDLTQLSREELLIMRNEIYARHGMVFRQKELQDYFQKQSWYQPRGSLDNQGIINSKVIGELNATEKKNIEMIIQYARKTGQF